MTLLVPYRDREEHLKEFVSCMRHHDIVIIEQADNKPFNRGKLINAGFLEIQPDHFCAHDIDMIPIKADYSYNMLTQMASSEIQKVDYLGGVTMYSKTDFLKAGGYHNDFWHRAEDNEMMFNLKRLNILVNKRKCTFRQLPHPRTGPEFIPELWQKAQLFRTKDMLKTCEYKLISKEVKDGYTHLKVEL